MNRATETSRWIGLLAGAFVIGLAALLIAIAVADSPVLAGIALAWILAVLLYSRHALRCPLCGAAALNAPVGRGLRWLMDADRKCPRCGASWNEAPSVRSSGRRAAGEGERRNSKETRI